MVYIGVGLVIAGLGNLLAYAIVRDEPRVWGFKVSRYLFVTPPLTVTVPMIIVGIVVTIISLFLPNYGLF